jgi:dynein heavy chain
MIGECNYGGWVTDDKDRWLIKTLLKDFLNIDLINQEKYHFIK